MDPFTLALIAAGITGTASYFGTRDTNATNLDIAQQTNAQNSQLNATNNAFNERMANTTMQRTKADMIKAGINPMYMVSKGFQDSSPTASSVQAQTGAPMQSPSQGITSALSSALDLAAFKSKIDNTNAQTAATTAQAELNRVSALTQQATAKKIGVDTKNVETQLPHLQTKADSWKRLDQFITHMVSSASELAQHSVKQGTHRDLGFGSIPVSYYNNPENRL